MFNVDLKHHFCVNSRCSMEPGVNLTNILLAAYTSEDSKSTKRHWWLDCLFVISKSACIKALCKHVCEIDWDVLSMMIWLEFTHRVTIYHKHSTNILSKIPGLIHLCRFHPLHTGNIEMQTHLPLKNVEGKNQVPEYRVCLRLWSLWMQAIDIYVVGTKEFFLG